MADKYKKNRFQMKMIFAVVFAAFSFSSFAQDSVKVTGVVYSHTGTPLPGISVSVAGSMTMPSITDESGHYKIMSASGDEWIIFSSTGDYKMKNVYLNNRATLDVFLTPVDLLSGEDVITILARPQMKRNMISAYSPVNTNEVAHSAVPVIDQYLQGRAAGVYAINRSGQPGSGSYINIRGINSLNANNQPLFIIDGIPVTQAGVFSSAILGNTFNPLVELSPVDVSSINILKDPTVTAAYGSRGSNGLILIETLNPTVTRTEIDLDVKTGISLLPSRQITQLNALQHKALMNEVLYSSGLLDEDIREQYPSLFYDQEDPEFIDYQHNTNWQDLIFRNSVSSSANINVKGGDEIAIYGLSVGLTRNRGVIKNTDYFGYNLRFVSKLNVFRWFKMNANVSFNYNKSNLKEAGSSEQTSPILTALHKSPLLNPYKYDENGKEISTLCEVDAIGVSNPLAVVNGFEGRNTNASFVFSIGGEVTINPNASFVSKINLTYNTLKESVFMPSHGMSRYYDGEAYNVAKSGTDKITSIYNNTYLHLHKTLGSYHNLSSMTGFQLQSNNFEYDWGLTKNSHSSDQYKTLQYGTDVLREIGGLSRNWNWMSIYENLNYTYKDKYIITGTVSFDGSSRVGNDALNTIKLGGNPIGLFYSAGLAWRLSNETFLKNKYWLEDLRLRLSYGKTGNDDLGESSSMNYYRAVQFRETVGLYPAGIPNSTLTYENVSQINLGIDVSLWGNRITASVDAFRSQTRNMLIYNPVESYYGFEYRLENSGQMVNKGLEFSLFARLVSEGNFKWDLNGNMSLIKNVVTNIKGSQIVTEILGGELINMEGKQANSFYGYIFKGVYATENDANTANKINDRGIAYSAGDAIYADLSGPDGIPDGVINDYDKTTIGSPLPSIYGTLVNTFSYKNFHLSATIQFVKGNEIFNYVRYQNERMTGLENQSAYTLNRWQYEGQVTNVPRALWKDPVGNSAFSTRWIEDGSFMRLKNVTISYKVPGEFFKFKNAEIYFTAYNLLTFTKYLGYDPEFSYSNLQIDQGIDYGLTPQTRQFILGVKVGL